MQDDELRNSRQKIALNSQKYDPYTGKKQARIELRALKDALPLHIVTDSFPREDIPEGVEVKRVTAYCIADRINLKNLSKHLHEDANISKCAMYFGECLYNSVRLAEDEFSDVFFFDYGVIVFWGMQEPDEIKILNSLKHFIEGKYEFDAVEKENFNYGIIKENSRVINDVIYLQNEYYFNKMVISNAIAQSVKLDYFENIVENTIDSVRDLPEEVEHEGKVGKSRKEVLKLVGKLHKLRFNLNLISNILDEPEILWHHPEHQSLYQSFNHYLEIKPRATVLNMRCDIIQGILAILSENISTRNSESLEKTMIFLIFASLIIGIIQIFVLYWRTSK